MALGIFGNEGRTVDNNTQDIDPNRSSPNSSTAKDGYYDPESQNEKGRRPSRVAAPGAVTTDDRYLDVDKQMELESTNSIKYRTCTWQKVI